MKKSAKIFADSLRANRKRLGLTQETLAERLGVTPHTIQSYEAGRREPDFTMLGQLAHALGTEPWELLRPPDAPPLLTAAEPTHREHTLADCKRAVDAALERQMAADAETRAKANAKTGPGAQDAREKPGEEKE